LAEKFDEFGKELYVCYIDFWKAFDSVWCKGLWKVLRHYGYPEKIIRILENMYKDTFSTARVNGEISNWFSTIVSVLQGFVLSPLLFIIFLEAVIAIALDNSHSGAVINGVVIRDLRFADDIALLSDNVSDLQVTVDCIAQTAKNLDMCINVSKTEIHYISHGSNNFQIYINGQELQQTDNFVYLGGNICTHDGVDGDINRRIGLARTVFQMLKKVMVIYRHK